MALAVVPPLLLIRAMIRDSVDLPWVDQWSFAREVVRAHDGTLTAADLWAQHNEHRVPATKIVLHVLARLSGWNVHWEVAAILIVALAALMLVAWAIVRSVGPIAPRAVGVLLLAAAAAQTSLVQWQNWTWGWQLGLLLVEASALGMAAALVLLAPGAPALCAVVVVLLAVVAALSNGAGLVLLGVAPLALLGLRVAGVAVSTRALLGAVTVGVVVAVGYAIGWHPALDQPRVTGVRGNVVALLRFVLTFLGGPIASWSAESAWRWGMIGTGTAMLCMLATWRLAPSRRAAVVPWAALVAFAVGAATLTAAGRLAAGPRAALLSRYATFAVPLWIGLGPLVTIAIASIPSRRLRSSLTGVALVGLGLAFWDGTASWLRGDALMAARAFTARSAAVCVARAAAAPDECYRAICWDAAFAREGALALEARRLGPWRRTP